MFSSSMKQKLKRWSTSKYGSGDAWRQSLVPKNIVRTDVTRCLTSWICEVFCLIDKRETFSEKSS